MEINESRRCLCNSGFVGSGLVCSGKKENRLCRIVISLGIEEYDSAESQVEVEAVNLRSPVRRCNHEATWRERERAEEGDRCEMRIRLQL